MKKYFIAGFMVLAATCLYAGWVHQVDKTVYITGPSPSSCFTRDASDNILPVSSVQMFAENTKLITGNVATNIAPNCGFFRIDANGDYYPVSSTADYAQRGLPGSHWDAEWDVDSSGNVFPRD